MNRESFIDSLKEFIEKTLSNLRDIKFNYESYEIDHVCYRVSDLERYFLMKQFLSQNASLLIESEVGGRLIATYRLYEPVKVSNYSIDILELPQPKKNVFYQEGFEHLEFVIKESFDDLMKKYKNLRFDLTSAKKSINPDIRLKLKNNLSVKFHHQSLFQIIEQEAKS